MSAEHPIVAITGSSSAVSDALITALEHVFWKEQVKAAYIEGTAFFRYERDAMREKMQKMREEQTAKIKAVLSEEQFAKYEQIQAERLERMRQGGFGGQGGPQN